MSIIDDSLSNSRSRLTSFFFFSFAIKGPHDSEIDPRLAASLNLSSSKFCLRKPHRLPLPPLIFFFSWMSFIRAVLVAASRLQRVRGPPKLGDPPTTPPQRWNVIAPRQEHYQWASSMILTLQKSQNSLGGIGDSFLHKDFIIVIIVWWWVDHFDLYRLLLLLLLLFWLFSLWLLSLCGSH